MNELNGGKKITNAKEELLGQGSFGCIIKPEPKCNKTIVDVSEYKLKNGIAKVYIDDDKIDNNIDIAKEIEFSKLFSKYDKNQDYFVMPVKFCKNTRTQMDKHKAFRLCKTPSEQMEFIFSVMENQEYDMYEYIYYYNKKNKALFPKKAWIILLENLLKGIKQLIKHKCVHQDIKVNNITYKNKLKLIDFGLFEHFEDIYTINNPRLEIYSHYYPLEYILINDYLHNKLYNKINKQQFTSEILQDFYYSIYDYGSIGIHNYYYFITHNKLEDKTIKQINKYISDPDKYYKNINKYIDKIDLYALGSMCVYINNELSNDGLTKNEINKYDKFVKGLIEIDPHKRFTIKQALDFYYTILKNN
jgi:serine/threonine protein kinase